ncbi:MAG: glycosyltransferase [Deltaproteobacteria bacterium]|nr:glycosyltransferase [Deltaproteobacteria bacterium]
MMKAAFFHDNRFARDASGVYYTHGALGYQVLSRYLAHFDRLVVVGRQQGVTDSMRTVASGPGVEMACTEVLSLPWLMFGPEVRRHVREVMSGIDCAVIRLPSALGEVACREAIRTGKPWMVEVVGCAWDSLWNHGSLAGKVLALRGWAETHRWVRRAPFALYVSRFLQRRYPSSGMSITCSDVALEQPDATILERRLSRLQGGASNRSQVLGLVGSLNVAYKGHETALRALALVVRAMPQLRLRFLGEGDTRRWRRRAEELGVEGNVEFCGSLPNGRAVLEWMDELDLLVVPSFAEGLGRAIIEAMSRALPVIGSNIGGNPELIDPQYTHSPGDHERLAWLIKGLLEKPAEMRQLAQRNWSKAREYQPDILEERRNRFFRGFKSYAAGLASVEGRGGLSRASGE